MLLIKKIHKNKDQINNGDNGDDASIDVGDNDKNGIAGTCLKTEHNENTIDDNNDNVINTKNDVDDKIDLKDLLEDQEFQRNISFGQLG